MTHTKDDEIYEVIHSRSWHRLNHGSCVVATMDGQARSVLECLTPLSLSTFAFIWVCMALAAVLNSIVPIYFSNCCGHPALCCLLIMSAKAPFELHKQRYQRRCIFPLWAGHSTSSRIAEHLVGAKVARFQRHVARKIGHHDSALHKNNEERWITWITWFRNVSDISGQKPLATGLLARALKDQLLIGQSICAQI